MAKLRFPQSNNTHNIYFIQMDIYNIEPVSVNIKGGSVSQMASAVQDMAGQLFNYEKSKKDQNLEDTITLPLQSTVTEETAASYSDKSMKGVSKMANIVSGGGLEAAKEALGSTAMDALGKAGEQIKDASRAAARKAVNEQMQTIYEGPEKRKYSFEFTLIAKNNDDSKMMKKIANRLHYHASPKLSKHGNYFDYPNMAVFHFRRRTGAGGNNQASLEKIDGLFESKFCYIENVSIEYGDDMYKEFADVNDNIGPGIMTISLDLQEVEFWVQDDFTDDTGE